MRKLLSVMMVFVMIVAMSGCVYMEDHFILNEDGSGTLYSYVLIEKEVYDSLIGTLGSLGEDGAASDLLGEATGQLAVVTVDGVEYYEMEQSQEFTALEDLNAFLSGEYDDVRVTSDTIGFRVAMDEEDMDGMTYDEVAAVYGEMGIDVENAIEGYMIFRMPEPIVYTTGDPYDDAYSAIYSVNLKTMYDGMDVFVTCSEEEAANEKIRNGVERTKITLKSSLTSKGKIKLSWSKSSNYKMDYYEVFRSTKKNSGYGSKAYYKTSSGSKTSYTNSKVKSGTRYYYKVRGVRLVDGEKIYTPYSNKANRKAQ